VGLVPVAEPPAILDAAVPGRPDLARGGTRAVDTGAGASFCGNERPDIREIENADGLAIAGDGTIYFTRGGEPEAWVGRLRPHGSRTELYWIRIPGSGLRLWGLAVDDRRNCLYVAAGDTRAIYRVDLTLETPAVEPFATGLMSPNDIALDGQGNVYFSERGDGKVHRVTPEGMRNDVTPSSVDGRNWAGGLAFGPLGALFVGTYQGIVRIELESGVERSRALYGAFSGRGNGLAFDAAGRLYVGTYSPDDDAQLVRIDGSEATAVELQAGTRFSSLAFGRGALDCKDLYIAMPAGPMHRIATDSPGAPVP
jgi:sugar lactone lactonase YvrE